MLCLLCANNIPSSVPLPLPVATDPVNITKSFSSTMKTLCNLLEIGPEDYEEVLSQAPYCQSCIDELIAAGIKIDSDLPDDTDSKRISTKRKLMTSWMKLQSEDVHAINYCPWQSVRLRILLELGIVIEVMDEPKEEPEDWSDVDIHGDGKTVDDNFCTSGPFHNFLAPAAAGTEQEFDMTMEGRKRKDFRIFWADQDSESTNEAEPLCLVVHTRNESEGQQVESYPRPEDNNNYYWPEKELIRNNQNQDPLEIGRITNTPAAQVDAGSTFILKSVGNQIQLRDRESTDPCESLSALEEADAVVFKVEEGLDERFTHSPENFSPVVSCGTDEASKYLKNPATVVTTNRSSTTDQIICDTVIPSIDQEISHVSSTSDIPLSSHTVTSTLTKPQISFSAEDQSRGRRSKRKPLRPTKGIYSLKLPDTKTKEPHLSNSPRSCPSPKKFCKQPANGKMESMVSFPFSCESHEALGGECWIENVSCEVEISSTSGTKSDDNSCDLDQEQMESEFEARGGEDCVNEPIITATAVVVTSGSNVLVESGAPTTSNSDDMTCDDAKDTPIEKNSKSSISDSPPVHEYSILKSLFEGKGPPSKTFSKLPKLTEQTPEAKSDEKSRKRKRSTKFSSRKVQSRRRGKLAVDQKSSQVQEETATPNHSSLPPLLEPPLEDREMTTSPTENEERVTKRSRRSGRRIQKNHLYSSDFEAPEVKKRGTKRKSETENGLRIKISKQAFKADSSLARLTNGHELSSCKNTDHAESSDPILSVLNDNKTQPCSDIQHEEKKTQRKYECLNKGCDRQFNTKDRRDNHFKRKHQGLRNLFACDICGKTFPARTRLTTHLERHEKAGKTYPCTQCEKEFPTQKKLEFHLYQHSQNWGLYCDVCNKGFPSGQEQRLANHRKIHDETRPRPFECSTCGRTFSSQQYLNIHQKNHPIQPDDDGMYRCRVETCQMTFKAVTSYREHQKIHTGELPFKCEVCGKRFGYITGYKKHMVSHTDEKSHTCHICGKQFKQKGNLNLHIGRHNGVKPYKCTYSGCNYSFFDQYKLKNHLDVHTGRRIYKCGECDKCFRTTTGLKSHHAAVHAKERKYKCHCGKTFSQKQYLQFHKTQHPELNLKRFTCDVCSKKFSEPSSLREHKRRFHTGETSFQCDKCDYTACFKSRMEKHMLTHNNPQFDCTTCGKQFRQVNNLKRHVLTVHSGKIKEEIDDDSE